MIILILDIYNIRRICMQVNFLDSGVIRTIDLKKTKL